MTTGPVVLFVCPDRVGPSMAGPGIRAFEMARSLAPRFHPYIAGPPGSFVPEGSGIRLLSWEERGALLTLARTARAVVVQGDVLLRFPELGRLETPLAVDLYDPFLFESLRQQQDRAPALQDAWQRSVQATLAGLLTQGDYFLCASERQRDLWLGMLAAMGRLVPAEYARDATMRQLIDVVPFGLPAPGPEPAPAPPLPPGLEPAAPLVWWGGGLWDWLDPLTLLQAVQALREGPWPDLAIVFAGTRRPHGEAATSTTMQDAALAYAREAGLLERGAWFREWTPYEERWAWLRHARVGAVLDQPDTETRFAWRTRVLDHVWAGLPTVISDGSATADLVAQHGLGLVVPHGDVAATAAALDRLLREGVPAERFALAQEMLRWGEAVGPLRAWLEAPRRTRPGAPAGAAVTASGGEAGTLPSPGPVQLMGYGWAMLRESGPRRTLAAARTWLAYQQAQRRARREGP